MTSTLMKTGVRYATKSHPHYSEVYKHLYDQVRDQLNDICYTRSDRSADTTRENPNFTGSEET